MGGMLLLFLVVLLGTTAKGENPCAGTQTLTSTRGTILEQPSSPYPGSTSSCEWNLVPQGTPSNITLLFDRLTLAHGSNLSIVDPSSNKVLLTLTKDDNNDGIAPLVVQSSSVTLRYVPTISPYGFQISYYSYTSAENTCNGEAVFVAPKGKVVPKGPGGTFTPGQNCTFIFNSPLGMKLSLNFDEFNIGPKDRVQMFQYNSTSQKLGEYMMDYNPLWGFFPFNFPLALVYTVGDEIVDGQSFRLSYEWTWATPNKIPCQCMAARKSYLDTYLTVVDSHLDPIYDAQTVGSPMRGFSCSFCDTTPAPYNMQPDDAFCNCSVARADFLSHYPNLGLTEADALLYWLAVKDSLTSGGMMWRCDLCMLEVVDTCSNQGYMVIDGYYFPQLGYVAWEQDGKTISTGGFSIEAWVKLFFYLEQTITSSDLWSLSTKNNKVVFTVSGNSYESLSLTYLPLLVWTHVAISVDADGYTFYINGISHGHVQASLLPIPTQHIIVGDSVRPLSGIVSFDEVRIWDRSVSQSDVITAMESVITSTQPNLVMSLSFNENLRIINSTTTFAFGKYRGDYLLTVSKNPRYMSPVDLCDPIQTGKGCVVDYRHGTSVCTPCQGQDCPKSCYYDCDCPGSSCCKNNTCSYHCYEVGISCDFTLQSCAEGLACIDDFCSARAGLPLSPCTSNSQCVQFTQCIDGACVGNITRTNLAPAMGVCTRNEDCENGACWQGKCGCSSDFQCGGRLYCSSEYKCTPRKDVDETCTLDHECDSQRCMSGKCRCNIDNECEWFEACKASCRVSLEVSNVTRSVSDYSEYTYIMVWPIDAVSHVPGAPPAKDFRGYESASCSGEFCSQRSIAPSSLFPLNDGSYSPQIKTQPVFVLRNFPGNSVSFQPFVPVGEASTLDGAFCSYSSPGFEVKDGGYFQFPEAFNVWAGDFTISFYFKSNELKYNMASVLSARSACNNAENYFEWRMSSESIVILYNNADSGLFSYTTSYTLPVLTTWHHYALVRKGGQFFLYVDTILVGHSNASVNTMISANFDLGYSPCVGSEVEGVDGVFAAVEIYPGAEDEDALYYKNCSPMWGGLTQIFITYSEEQFSVSWNDIDGFGRGQIYLVKIYVGDDVTTLVTTDTSMTLPPTSETTISVVARFFRKDDATMQGAYVYTVKNLDGFYTYIAQAPTNIVATWTPEQEIMPICVPKPCPTGLVGPGGGECIIDECGERGQSWAPFGQFSIFFEGPPSINASTGLFISFWFAKPTVFHGFPVGPDYFLIAASDSSWQLAMKNDCFNFKIGSDWLHSNTCAPAFANTYYEFSWDFASGNINIRVGDTWYHFNHPQTGVLQTVLPLRAFEYGASYLDELFMSFSPNGETDIVAQFHYNDYNLYGTSDFPGIRRFFIAGDRISGTKSIGYPYDQVSACDYRVTCTMDYENGKTCGPCPPNMLGSGSVWCSENISYPAMIQNLEFALHWPLYDLHEKNSSGLDFSFSGDVTFEGCQGLLDLENSQTGTVAHLHRGATLFAEDTNGLFNQGLYGGPPDAGYFFFTLLLHVESDFTNGIIFSLYSPIANFYTQLSMRDSVLHWKAGTSEESMVTLASSPLSTGEWHHLAFGFLNHFGSLYVDGELREPERFGDSLPFALPPNSVFTLTIGDASNSGQFFVSGLAFTNFGIFTSYAQSLYNSFANSKSYLDYQFDFSLEVENSCFNDTRKVTIVQQNTDELEYYYNGEKMSGPQEVKHLLPGASANVTVVNSYTKCSKTKIATTNALVSVSATPTPSKCHANGSVTAMPNGNPSEYTYKYTSKGSQVVLGHSVTEALPAGNYIIIATDTYGCSANSTFTISYTPCADGESCSADNQCSGTSKCTSAICSVPNPTAILQVTMTVRADPESFNITRFVELFSKTLTTPARVSAQIVRRNSTKARAVEEFDLKVTLAYQSTTPPPTALQSEVTKAINSSNLGEEMGVEIVGSQVDVVYTPPPPDEVVSTASKNIIALIMLGFNIVIAVLL